ncbi:MAG: HD domain-containing protein [Gemmatimonadales bacterium]
MTNPAHLLGALGLAAERHRDQRRKGAEKAPYVNHLIAVAHVLATTGGVGDETLLVAALLHDTVEDTDTTPAELAERFGERVAALVAELTDDKSLDKDVRKRLQVEHAPHASADAKLLKLADKIANVEELAASPPADWPAEQGHKFLAWSEEVVTALGPVHEAMETRFQAAVARARAGVTGG